MVILPGMVTFDPGAYTVGEWADVADFVTELRRVLARRGVVLRPAVERLFVSMLRPGPASEVRSGLESVESTLAGLVCTTAEASVMAEVSQRAIEQACDRGDLVSWRSGRGPRVIDRRSVAAYVHRRKLRQSTPDEG